MPKPPEATEQKLDQTSDCNGGDCEAARNEAYGGMKSLAGDAKTPAQIGESAGGGKSTSEVLGTTPEFFDSSKEKAPADGRQPGETLTPPDKAAMTHSMVGGEEKTPDQAAKDGAKEVHDSLRYWNQPDRLNKALENKSPEQIKAMDTAFKDEYKVGMKDYIMKEMDPSPERTKALTALGETPEVAKKGLAKAARDAAERVKEAADREKEAAEGNAPKDKQDSEAAKTRLETNLKSKQMDEFDRVQFNDQIHRIENRQPPVSAKERGQLYNEVSKLLEAKDPPVRADLPHEKERIQLAKQLLTHAAHPEQVAQGPHNTCGAASLESKLYTTNPSAVAHMVTEVATTGQFTPLYPNANNNTPIKIDSSVVKPDAEGKESLVDWQHGKRDYSSQIFQGSATSITHEGYQVVKPTPGDQNDTGERYKYGKFTGMQNYDAEDMEKKITGNPNPLKPIELSRPDDPDQRTKVTSDSQMRYRLEELKKNGQLPVTVIVDVSKEPFKTDATSPYAGGVAPGGLHAVTITDYDPQTQDVSVNNQWGPQENHNGRPDGKPRIKADDLYKALARRPGDTRL